jgi:hypothetical protein
MSRYTRIFRKQDKKSYLAERSAYFGGRRMKALLAIGLIVLVLGIVSFVVPFPHASHHELRAGDAHVGVTTRHDERVPPAVSVLLVVVGAGIMIAGSSKA